MLWRLMLFYLRTRMIVLAAAATSLIGLGCEGETCGTPLVLSFDGSAVAYVADPGGAYFELGQHDGLSTTDWPTSNTPWLARDLDGDGAISGGAELFGSETVLRSGHKAANGFEALAELDTDGDGRVGASDGAAWGSLLLWRDDNANRRTDEGEIQTASAAGILWIDLPGAPGKPAELTIPASRAPRCDARGNCEVERSAFGYVDGRREQKGAMIDIHLHSFVKGVPGKGAPSVPGAPEAPAVDGIPEGSCL
jgi:hypothetical protein